MDVHSVINPAINYWGTPVVLVTTINEDGSPNIAPMSSAWWLGDRCMIGLGHNSQTTFNLRRTGECVLNLASDDMAAPINALARTTGTSDIPLIKILLGYRYEKDKFGISRLTPMESELIRPPRIKECPVQMETQMAGIYEMMSDLNGPARGFTLAVELRILRTYALNSLRLAGYSNRINHNAWHPMIMNFQHLYALRYEEIEESTLAEVDEELYRMHQEQKESIDQEES